MRDDFNFAKAIEQSGENDASHENAGFVGPAEDPPKLEFRFFLALVIRETRAARGMHPNGSVEFGHFLEDRQEIGFIQRPSVHIRKNLRAHGAKFFQRALDLFYGGSGMIHGQGGDESSKAMGVLGDQFG